MKAIFILLLSICVLTSVAQNDNKHSIGVDANYISPYSKETTNNFNYGFSLLMSEKVFHRIKLSIGINYSCLSSYVPNEEHFGDRYLKDRQHETEYLNFPFLISFIKNSAKQFKLDPYIGVIASKVISYEYMYYVNDQPQNVDWEKVPAKLGWFFRTGINVSKPINKHLVLNAAPYVDILMVEYADYGAWSSYPPTQDFTFGFKLGLDYQW